MFRVGIGIRNERFAGGEERIQTRLAISVGHLFAHPFPEAFDGVQVGAVPRQRNHFKTQLHRFFLRDPGTMYRRTVPNKGRLGQLVGPLRQLLQKGCCAEAVAFGIRPDHGLAVFEVIGAVPIDLGMQSGRGRRHEPAPPLEIPAVA